MRDARAVGWDSLRGEFQFIADDPGPVLLVPPSLLEEAFQQRDGSWLLRGYTQPDYSEWCEFTVRTPVLQLARSLMPAVTPAAATPQTVLESSTEAQAGRVGWPLAPPQPASASDNPVRFYKPRTDAVERVEVVPLNTEATPPSAPELYDLPEREERSSFSSKDYWIVRYVLSDPKVADETERSLRVRADSDAGALRALHAEMSLTSDEPAYRVLSVVPEDHAGLAA